jgi:hypothetical protein
MAMTMISKLLGLKTAEKPEKTNKPALAGRKAAKSAPADNRDNPRTIEDNSDNGIRRQLVQVLLRDCLRKNGIPTGWVECQMMVVSSRSRGPGMYVRLVMRHWDLRLLTYAHAFEAQLLAAITQFEPEASTWLQGISWDFDVGNTCPYLDMPEPAFWLAHSAPAHASAPSTVAATVAVPAGAVAATAAGTDTDAEVLQDLQRMFAIRDADIEQQAATAPVDFQNTEPSRPV